METNIIVNADSLEYLKSMPDESVDLIMTSPPYAMQRKDTYGGISEDDYPDWFMLYAKEMYRVLKPTGSFILNIKENVKNGVRSLYVMKLVIQLASIFRLTDTFIWAKPNPFPTGSKRRLKDGFEYCYWFTKSKDYKCYPEHVLVKSTSKYRLSEEKRTKKGEHNTKNGSGMNMRARVAGEYVRPSNVLSIPCGGTSSFHPASYPVELPVFFIKLLTDEGDIVVDPFSGSGTTCLASKNLNRNWIGIEINNDFVEKSRERLGLSQ